jgi:hypothetical protein
VEIPEITPLLKADEANVQTMQRFFANASSELPKLLNEASAIYSACSQAFGQGLAQASLNVAPEETAIQRIQAALLRGLLLSQIGVLFGLEVADFLRMRVTAPLVNVRLQCESYALMKLMRQNPAIAREWQEIQTDEEGKRFFGKHQKRLKKTLESYDLASAYDRTSGVALHSRFIGLARGFRNSQTEDAYRKTQKFMFLAQEFDRERPHYFLSEVLFTLQVQERIFVNMRDVAPEIADAVLLDTRIPQFRAGMARFIEDLKIKLSGFLARGRQTKP